MEGWLQALGGLPVAQGGMFAVTAAFVYALLAGRLVPRSHVVDLRQDRTERVTEIAGERDDWKAAWMAETEKSRILASQVGELLEMAKTTDQFIRGLKSTESR